MAGTPNGPKAIHGIAHASVVVTFGKNQPFFYRGKSIKEMEACGGKEEETWYECHIFEILKLSIV